MLRGDIQTLPADIAANPTCPYNKGYKPIWDQKPLSGSGLHDELQFMAAGVTPREFKTGR